MDALGLCLGGGGVIIFHAAQLAINLGITVLGDVERQFGRAECKDVAANSTERVGQIHIGQILAGRESTVAQLFNTFRDGDALDRGTAPKGETFHCLYRFRKNDAGMGAGIAF